MYTTWSSEPTKSSIIFLSQCVKNRFVYLYIIIIVIHLVPPMVQPKNKANLNSELRIIGTNFHRVEYFLPFTKHDLTQSRIKTSAVVRDLD